MASQGVGADYTTNANILELDKLKGCEKILGEVAHGIHHSVGVRMHRLNVWEGEVKFWVASNERPSSLRPKVSIENFEEKVHPEYYFRHMNGCTPDAEGEKERVIKCLEAAIHRRISEGLSLEVSVVLA
ncbi:hypothetical protein Droror1_Dr00025499 [Drosera rotundifolia]